MGTKTSLPPFFTTAKPLVENALEQFVSETFSDDRQQLQEAIRYSLFAKSKRVRPLLSLISYGLFKDDSAPILPAACALECIHTYSLIHDDLPAMDDDDYRRGQLTSHKKYGEDMAVLAGDALQTLAFDIMATHLTPHFSAELILKAIQHLAHASGINGMIGGQVLDIKGHKSVQSPDLLNSLHQKKTGALIRASLVLPALLLDVENKTQTSLKTLGDKLGLLFQVVDDILDIVGTTETLGKSAAKDTAQEKLTYISLYGLEKSQDIATKLCEESLTLIESLEVPHPNLKESLSQLTRYILERNR